MDESRPRARFVVDRCPAPGDVVSLAREEALHARARRLAAGDRVKLVDGTGREASGRIVEVSRARVRVAVESASHREEPATDVALLVAGLRPARLSWIAEKATELCAARLVLVATDRTQKFRASEASRGRLERVTREAAKQCESARWPSIEGPVPFVRVLDQPSYATRILLDLHGEPFPERLTGSVAILVGPEGGWSGPEREAAKAAGWLPVRLPAGKLRAETAAVAALVLASAALSRG